MDEEVVVAGRRRDNLVQSAREASTRPLTHFLLAPSWYTSRMHVTTPIAWNFACAVDRNRVASPHLTSCSQMKRLGSSSGAWSPHDSSRSRGDPTRLLLQEFRQEECTG
uniref:Uncharacterized protein n=1 Tax=Setaria italica TaxID=4555 RepID=K3ZKE9_SETIT